MTSYGWRRLKVYRNGRVSFYIKCYKNLQARTVRYRVQLEPGVQTERSMPSLVMKGAGRRQDPQTRGSK